MRRKILIIDDHDDLASALREKYSGLGHEVTIIESRREALAAPEIEDFDLVITDLDDIRRALASPPNQNNGGCAECLSPSHVEAVTAAAAAASNVENIKAFKICATNFRRDEFDEDELKRLVEIALDYKTKFVDQREVVQNLHENIEFELPSAISPMHSILDYLMKRVEKVGVVRSENSNLFIALDEAFVNAVKHGNKFDARKNIKITADVSVKEARFTIEDEGEGFDVTAIPDPCDPENLFKTSGRGVLFIYNIMDEVKYNERGNRLTMIKKSDKTENV
ncbi:MAG: ATP-binding protein [Acidobacteriota bacterium]|nr:ATP-binding protein [Acidobacteriota bacterium]